MVKTSKLKQPFFSQADGPLLVEVLNRVIAALDLNALSEDAAIMLHSFLMRVIRHLYDNHKGAFGLMCSQILVMISDECTWVKPICADTMDEQQNGEK